MGEQDAHQSRHQHRRIRTHRLHRDIEATPHQRRRLHQERRTRPHLPAQRKTLQQPEPHHQHRRPQPNGFIRGRQRQADHRDADQPERQQHRRLAPAPIAHAPDHPRAQRTGQKARTKRRQRGQQADAGSIRGKKRATDLRGEKGIGDEVIELQRIAQRHRNHMPPRQHTHSRRIEACGLRNMIGHRIAPGSPRCAWRSIQHGCHSTQSRHAVTPHHRLIANPQKVFLTPFRLPVAKPQSKCSISSGKPNQECLRSS